MRVGQNPIKWRRDEFRPERLTVATIVHIPERAGYWAESLEVMDLCLSSLRKNTSEPFDLMVLDNASCQEVQDHLIDLRRQGVIDYLILVGQNMRKLGAVKFLLGSAPGEIITLTDSDVYFFRGWFEATLSVMEAFPEAGQVTALPTGDRTKNFTGSTVAAAIEDNSIDFEDGPNLIPEIHLRSHADSLGISWSEYIRRMDGANQIRVTRRGISAYVSAQDFQYTTTRQAVQKLGPFDNPHDLSNDALYSPVVEAAMDAAGLWRLSTAGYFVHHLGNRLPPPEEVSALPNAESLVSEAGSSSTCDMKGRGSIENRYLRNVLKRVNSWTYKLLHG